MAEKFVIFMTVAIMLWYKPVICQSTVDSLAENLIVNYEVVQNPTASLTNLCKSLKADWGLCSQVKLYLIYRGQTPIHDTKWDIYIHSIRRILKMDSDLFTVQHVNGDLHRIKPTAKFGGFELNATIEVPMVIEYWILTYSDIMPNMFVASGSKAKVITSTSHDSNLGTFASGVKGQNTKRMDNDHSVTMTPQTRFLQNKQNKLYLLPREQIQGVIIPTPKAVKVGNDQVDLTRGVYLSGNVWSSFSADTKEVVVQKFESFGIQVWNDGDNEAKKAYYIIVCSAFKAFDGSDIDPYRLQIGKLKAVVEGDEKGSFYGLQSLLSLIHVGSKQVPTIDVQDSARFPHRGMMADVGRNFKSKQAILRLLDQMAYYKLNTFHFHASDDEGWRVEIPDLEELTEYGSKRCFDSDECLLPQLGSGTSSNNQGSGFYSVDEYEEIVRFAKARFIKVVPEFDMPGHARAAVMSMEKRFLKYKNQDLSKANQYRLLDPDDKSNFLSVQYYDRTTALNPCMPSTYKFVEKVISEVQKMHERAGQPLKEWHFGGDEAHNIFLKGGYKGYNYSHPQHEPWEESKICKEAQADIKKLPFEFMKQVKGILKSKGIDVMYAWSDAAGHPAYDVTRLGGNVKVTMWDTLEWGASDRFQQLAKAGFRVVNSMPDYLYFDMPYEANPFERGYYWATRYQDLKKVFSLAPVCIPQNVEYSLTRAGDKFGNQVIKEWPKYNGLPFKFDGIQGQIWCESVRTDEQFEYMVFPRLIAMAERAWHKGSWEADEKECEGTTFGYGPDGKPLHDSLDKINRDFNLFANVIGQRELAKLDLAKVKYRLPSPGYHVVNRNLYANTEIPGIKIEYSLDRGKTWKAYSRTSKPYVSNEYFLKVRSVNSDGTRVRVEQEEMRWPQYTPIDLCAKNPGTINAHPTDCSKFVNCSGMKPYIQSCPTGLLFEPKDKICHYPEQVKCS